MDVAEFDYELPSERIAQHPLPERDAARLLVDRGPDSPPDHRRVRDLPDLLWPGDVMVLNRSRVLPARLLDVVPRTHKPLMPVLIELSPVALDVLSRGETQLQ